ncbi:methyl-CpG-binding domain-containing protein 2-like isoform X1 [Oryza brachyantha]|uniref:methyl-CpG-binding domain-containing protein 2-like isoform X1 n=1 Tax=Oryza brachyantha TaxID=4533 RepID=UPI0007769DFE|nr:methyl-CpG-binding domain-containing protein 2-like isoform X1 [Oryza brachyantha]
MHADACRFIPFFIFLFGRPRHQLARSPPAASQVKDGYFMRTSQGHNPNNMKVRSQKSQPLNKKPRKFCDTVEVHIVDDDSDGDENIHKDYSMEDTSKQLIMYNPEIAYDKQGEAEVTEPIDEDNSLNQRFMKPRHRYNTVLPSIGAYTVQCARCFKWRIIPTKEKYEELRENIYQDVFVCERTSEWNRIISCVDPEDISQDGSRLWAIDKGNISQTPPGWDREVRIRGEGCSKFADVYYTSPSGKKLRSLVEIGRYLAENPHFIKEGVNLTQFSFATPKPLQEDYVRKHTYAAAPESPDLLETAQVDPLCWAAPPTCNELLGSSTSGPVDFSQSEVSNPVDLHQPKGAAPLPPHTKKKTKRGRVSARKRRSTPPGSSNDQSGGCVSDIGHVLL